MLRRQNLLWTMGEKQKRRESEKKGRSNEYTKCEGTDFVPVHGVSVYAHNTSLCTLLRKKKIIKKRKKRANTKKEQEKGGEALQKVYRERT